MVHNNPRDEVSSITKGVPWLLFFFLIAALFVVYHDITIAKSAIDDYNPGADVVISTVAQGTPGRRIALLALALVSACSLKWGRKNNTFTVGGPLGWLLISFFCWALLSPLWTDDLAQNLRRLFVFVIFALTAVAIARRLSFRQIILWTFVATSTFLTIGIVAEFVFGTLQPLAPGYRFAGSLYPNDQGINCGLLVLSSIACADLVKRRKLLFWSAGSVGFLFLILTGSRTALASVVAAFVLYMLLVRSKTVKIKVGLAAAGGTLLLLAALLFGAVPGIKNAILLGRNDTGSVDTFTGRSTIWADVVHYIQQRPLTGYGYGSFWIPKRIYAISGLEGWGVGNSHSVYIDYAATLGTVGVGLYILILLVGLSYAYRLFKVSRSCVFAFSMALLIFCLVDGFTESEIADATLLMLLWMVLLIRLAFIPVRGTAIANNIPRSVSTVLSVRWNPAD